MERSFADLITFEAHRVGEFFEIRRALEGWCASQAAKLGTDADFRAMKDRLDAMRDLDVTDEAWEENDIGFHKALAAATGNPLAVRIMEIMRESFTAFYRLKRYIPNREDQKTIWQHHVDIYDALMRPRTEARPCRAGRAYGFHRSASSPRASATFAPARTEPESGAELKLADL